MPLTLDMDVADLAATRFAISPLSETITGLQQLGYRAPREGSSGRWLEWAREELDARPLVFPSSRRPHPKTIADRWSIDDEGICFAGGPGCQRTAGMSRKIWIEEIQSTSGGSVKITPSPQRDRRSAAQNGGSSLADQGLAGVGGSAPSGSGRLATT